MQHRSQIKNPASIFRGGIFLYIFSVCFCTAISSCTKQTTTYCNTCPQYFDCVNDSCKVVGFGYFYDTFSKRVFVMQPTKNGKTYYNFSFKDTPYIYPLMVQLDTTTYNTHRTYDVNGSVLFNNLYQKGFERYQFGDIPYEIYTNATGQDSFDYLGLSYLVGADYKAMLENVRKPRNNQKIIFDVNIYDQNQNLIKTLKNYEAILYQ